MTWERERKLGKLVYRDIEEETGKQVDRWNIREKKMNHTELDWGTEVNNQEKENRSVKSVRDRTGSKALI